MYTSGIFVVQKSLLSLSNSVADPERFDADPDPDTTFQADVDPDQKFVNLGRKFFFQIFIFFFFIILQNFSCVIFSVTLREEGLGERDKM